MHVLLDTNVYYSDVAMTGARFQMLWDILQTVGGRLIVPEVVHAEVLQNYGKQLEMSLTQLAKVHHTARRLCLLTDMPAMELNALLAPDKLSGWKAFYDLYFRTTVRDRGAAMLAPSPSVSHSVLMKQAVAKVPPFKEKGTGYRDALIWHTALELLERGIPSIHFVSENTTDFAQDGQLHSSFIDQLNEKQLPPDSLIFYPNLATFCSSALPPIEKEAETFQLSVFGRISVEQTLSIWIEQNLVRLLADQDLLSYAHPFDSDTAGVNVVRSRTIGCRSIRVKAVQKSQQMAFILMTAKVEIAFEIDASIDAILSDEVLRDHYSLADEDAEDGRLWLPTQLSSTCSFECATALDLSAPAVVAVDLCSIEGGFGNWRGEHPLDSMAWHKVAQR